MPCCVDTGDREFEPVIHYPALASFLLIAVIFTFLQIRINAISTAASYRVDALTKLREIKAAELSASGEIGSGGAVQHDEVSAAVRNYADALDKEEQMRTIVPGVRIAAPNNPNRRKEDAAAIQQFLKKGGTSREILERINDTDDAIMQRNTESRDAGLSMGAKSIMAVVALAQIILLILLSVTPMVANDFFTHVGSTV